MNEFVLSVLRFLFSGNSATTQICLFQSVAGWRWFLYMDLQTRLWCEHSSLQPPFCRCWPARETTWVNTCHTLTTLQSFPNLSSLITGFHIFCLHPGLGATLFFLHKLLFTESTEPNWSDWRKKMEKPCFFWTSVATSPRVLPLHENDATKGRCTTTHRSCRWET